MFIVYYTSTQEGCPSVVVSEVSPKLTPDLEVWVIESEVALKNNCDYIIHLTSRNGAGETNFTGTLSFS